LSQVQDCRELPCLPKLNLFNVILDSGNYLLHRLVLTALTVEEDALSTSLESIESVSLSRLYISMLTPWSEEVKKKLMKNSQDTL